MLVTSLNRKDHPILQKDLTLDYNAFKLLFQREFAEGKKKHNGGDYEGALICYGQAKMLNPEEDEIDMAITKAQKAVKGEQGASYSQTQDSSLKKVTKSCKNHIDKNSDETPFMAVF